MDKTSETTIKPVEVVTFERYKKVVKADKNVSQPKKRRDFQQELKDQEAKMKKFRHDVYKFAISGMEYNKKVEAKESLLMRLGAKPKKNSYVNYRDLMQQKAKEKKATEEERLRNDKSGLKNQPKSKVIKKRKQDINAVKGFDYQVGKFKKGVQYVSKKKLIN